MKAIASQLFLRMSVTQFVGILYLRNFLKFYHRIFILSRSKILLESLSENFVCLEFFVRHHVLLIFVLQVIP